MAVPAPSRTAPRTRQLVDETADDLRRQIDSLVPALVISYTFLIESGDPYSQLIHVADEVNADGVVVGGSIQAGHRFAGSIAIHLVKTGRKRANDQGLVHTCGFIDAVMTVAKDLAQASPKLMLLILFGGALYERWRG